MPRRGGRHSWRGPQVVYGGGWGWPPAMPIPYYAPVVDSNQQQQQDQQQKSTQASVLGIDNKTMLLLAITAVAVYWWATKRRS